ncbi:DUF6779 domain-containing protein [Actinokineospora sp. NBRC 105648]|uniref:DUF6779 domain-containing protein n=1 Tax=Actinokineospora sp. NBRC 105648 TaxID=3032206 RepID=UPI00249FB94D|nr:DUF6779 domain-containing protein [Actinokineospora sp. NBRC 105648]GLZ40352.1 hypothetical protein Acsp05_39760 [Actinokineospora sp. NBRC 105648]
MTGRNDSFQLRGASGARVLLIAALALALASTAVLVLSDSLRWMRLGVVAALWAALAGAFLAARYRRQVADRAEEAAELHQVYELELEREVSARREFELEMVAETRRKVEERTDDDLSELREELRALRQNLEVLLGGEVLVERFALHAEATRMRGIAEDRAIPARSGNQVRRIAAAQQPAAAQPAAPQPVVAQSVQQPVAPKPVVQKPLGEPQTELIERVSRAEPVRRAPEPWLADEDPDRIDPRWTPSWESGRHPVPGTRTSQGMAIPGQSSAQRQRPVAKAVTRVQPVARALPDLSHADARPVPAEARGSAPARSGQRPVEEAQTPGAVQRRQAGHDAPRRQPGPQPSQEMPVPARRPAAAGMSQEMRRPPAQGPQQGQRSPAQEMPGRPAQDVARAQVSQEMPVAARRPNGQETGHDRRAVAAQASQEMPAPPRRPGVQEVAARERAQVSQEMPAAARPNQRPQQRPPVNRPPQASQEMPIPQEPVRRQEAVPGAVQRVKTTDPVVPGAVQRAPAQPAPRGRAAERTEAAMAPVAPPEPEGGRRRALTGTFPPVSAQQARTPEPEDDGGGRRRRAEGTPAWHEQIEAEDTGSHASGKSVNELLAAHGGAAGPRRRRRRDED